MVWGISMDLYPFRSNILAMLSVFAVGCITILWSGQNKVTYLITVVSTYFCYGGLYSVFPTQTVRMLGRVVGPKLYYLTFVGFSLGVIIQYVSHKFLVEAYGTNGYLYCFILYGALLVVAFGVVLTTEFPQHAGEAIRG
jgi:MFS family permease